MPQAPAGWYRIGVTYTSRHSFIPSFLSIVGSPVFSQMFSHSTKETVEGRIQIQDACPGTVAELLEYVYTGNCQTLRNGDAEAVVTLYSLADRYLMDDLKARCLSVQPTGGLTQENAIELWGKAHLYGLLPQKRGNLVEAFRKFCWT